MLKSRVGILLGVAGLLLALSPEARRAARRAAVKGTETFLDLADQVKEAGAGLQNRLTSLADRSNSDVEKVRNQ